MTKSAFFRIFGIFGAILACAGFAFPAAAIVNISTTFESYATGTEMEYIIEDKGENGYTWATSSQQVIDSIYYSESNSLDLGFNTTWQPVPESYKGGFIIGELPASSTIHTFFLSFKVWFNSYNGGIGAGGHWACINFTPEICFAGYSSYGSPDQGYGYYIDDYYDGFHSAAAEEWHSVMFIMDEDDTEIKFYWDYVLIDTFETSLLNYIGSNLYFSHNTDHENPYTDFKVYIDDFSLIIDSGTSEPGTFTNYGSFDFSSNFPILCEHNESDFSGTASGYVDMDDDSTLHFNNLILKAMDVGTRETYFASTSFPYVEAGDFYEFSIDYDFPTGTTYWIEYILSGYNKEDDLTMGENVLYYIPSGNLDRVGNYDIDCLTSLGNATGTSLDRIWVVPEPEDGLEDCSGLTFTETMLCEIRNSIIWALMPSAGKMEQLFARTDDLKYKFPLNYIEATKYHLGLFYEYSEATTSATSTFDQYGVLGKGIADMSKAAGDLDFFETIRNVLSIMVVVYAGYIIIKMGFSLLNK